MKIKFKFLGLILMLNFLSGELKAQAPVAAFDLSDTITCIGVNVSYFDMSTGGVGGIVDWSWDFGDGILSSQQSPNHTYATGGIKTVTLTVTDAATNTSSISRDIYVIESVANQNVVRICSPTSTTVISANAPITSEISGYWFTAGTGVIDQPTNDTTLISNLISGTYIFYWVLSDGFCSDADQVTIVVDQPVSVNAGPDQNVCITTATATMAGSVPSPGTGMWSTSSSATITSPTNRNTTITGLNVAGTYPFVWSVTNGACVTRDTMLITVNPVPVVNAGINQNICSNPGTGTLTGNTPAAGTVQWTTSSSATITSPTSTTTPISNLTTTGSYTFIYTINDGACSNSDTVVVTADQFRAANAGNDLQVCSTTGTATLNGNNPAPGTGQWSTTGGATITSPASATTGVTGLVTPGFHYFIWTITNGTCVSRDTMVIIVRAPVISNAGTDQILCNVTSTSLAGNSAAPGSGTWTTTGGATITTPSSPVSTVSNLATGDNYFIWTITYGGCVTRDTVRIHVDALITANAGSDQQLCETTSATLAGNNPVPGTGTWTTSGSSLITSPAVFNSGVTGLTTGVHQYVWTIVNGGCTSRDTVYITVAATSPSNAGADQQLCTSAGTTALNGNIPASGSGLWSTASSAIINSPSSPSSTVSGLTTAGTYNFIWTITDGACISRDTVSVIVSLAQNANAGSDINICETTSSVNLAGNTPSAGTGTWTTGSGAIIASPNNPSSSVSGLSIGNNQFIWTIVNGACTSADTMNITVSEEVVADAGIDQQVCSSPGESTLGANNPAPGSGVWFAAGAGTITDPADPNSTVTDLTTPGMHEFIWMISNGSCLSMDTMVITVDEYIQATAGADQQLCAATASQLDASGSGSATGVWISLGSASVTDPLDSISGVTDLEPGINTFVWMVANGLCLSTDTTDIIVSEIDTADAGMDAQICSSTGMASVNATAPTTGTGIWTAMGGGTVTSPTSASTTITGLTAAGNYNFIWTVTNGSCVDSDTASVTVYLSEIADAGPDQQLCETTTSSTLAGNAAVSGTGTWTTSGSATITNINNPSSPVNNLSAGVHQFVWTIVNGSCSTSDTVLITIDTLIQADAGSDQQICSGTGTVFMNANDATPGSGAWFTVSSATIVDPSDHASQITDLTTGGSYEFIWMVSNGSCLTTDTMFVTVDDSIIPDAGADQQICETASTVQLNATTPSSGMGVWISTGIASVDDPLDPLSTVSGAIPGVNEFVWMVSNGMCLSMDTTAIIISTLVTADAGSDQQICASTGTVNLAGSDPAPGTSSWTTTSVASITDPSMMNTSVTGLNAGGMYDFIYTVTNGGCSSSDTMTVLVDDTVIVNAGPDQNLCETDTVSNLAAAMPAIGIAFWTTSSPATIVDPLDPNSQVTGLTTGQHEFVWNVNNGMCLNTDTTYINLHQIPTAPDAGADQVICSNQDTAFLQGNTPLVGVSDWNSLGVATIVNQADTFTAVTGLVPGINTFTYIINNNGCLLCDTVHIMVNPAPVADAGPDQFVSAMTPVNIGGSPAASGGTPPYIYNWNTIQYLDDSTFSNPQALSPVTMTYILQVTDSLGCTETDTMVLYVNDPPVAVDDSVVINEDSTVVISVLLNDSDPDNNLDSASVTLTVLPVDGSASVDSAGNIIYTPVANYFGNDSLQYAICDAGLPVYCDTAWVYITIDPVNDAPVAVDDSYTTMEDSCITVNVLLNDTDVENNIDSATFAILSGPSNGTFTLDTVPGVISYCPDTTFNGSDTLVYIICDSGSPVLCDTAYVIINVTPLNNVPVAVNDSLVICSSDSIVISALANDADVENDTLFLSIITPPLNGVAASDSFSIGYQPSVLYNGMDSIQYAACEVNNPGICDTAWIYIAVNAIPQLSVLNMQPVCASDSTGIIDLSVAGNAPFIYAWSNADTTQDLQDVPAGVYSVVVTDSAGCSSGLTDTLNSNVQINASIAVQNVNCFGDSTGSIDVTVTGGAMPYAYNWNTGESTEDIDSLVAGIYTLTIIDSTGCSVQFTDTVLQPSSPINASSIHGDVFCASDSAGFIDITVSGGTGSFQYLWSNGVTTEDVSMLVAGIYTVAITDSLGCQFAYSDSVNAVNPVVNVSYAVQNAFCLTSATGSIDVTATGGSGPLTYLWNTFDTTEDLVGLTAGTYTLVITDTLSCTTAISVAIADSSEINLTALGATTFCSGSDVDLSADIYNGVNYQWYLDSSIITGATSTTITVDSEGSYYVVASSGCGTFNSDTISVNVNTPPLIAVSDDVNSTCDSSVVLMASGGTTYSWFPAGGLSNATDSTPVATPVITTMYLVTVTDSNGCFSVDSILVTITCDSLEIPNGYSPNGDGLNDMFVISKIEDYPGNHLKIFNRWGNIVYDKVNYANTWDGKANVNLLLKGENLPEGTYYYVLDLGNGSPMTTGYIILRR